MISLPKAPAASMTDIHDIKPPESIGFDPALIHYALYALAALIVMGLLVGLFFYLKKRIKQRYKPPRILRPDEAALQAVEELARRMEDDGKAFYFALSAIFRTYLDGRFGLGSLEMTTEELLPGIDKLGVSRELKREIRAFLNASDPVKFAGYRVEREQKEKDLLLVKNFVRQTTPITEKV